MRWHRAKFNKIGILSSLYIIIIVKKKLITLLICLSRLFNNVFFIKQQIFYENLKQIVFKMCLEKLEENGMFSGLRGKYFVLV